MAKRLSEILTIKSDFNFFKSIANLEPFELQNLTIVVDDLINYTMQAELIFQKIDKEYKERMELDYNWVNEGYEKFYDVFRNIDSIDSIVLQALNLLENNMEKDPKITETDIFDKLEGLNEKSMFIKRHYLIPIKIKVDLTIEYNEIYGLTMNSVNKELENCLKKCFKIHEKRFSSPVRHAPSFNLEMLTKRLLQQRDRLRLPLLNSTDNELYEEYLDLKTSIDPIEASLKYIPSCIETFERKYSTTLKASNLDKLVEKYEDLVKEFNYLNNEVKDLKYDLIDSRWNEIFSYLNTEMSFLIKSVEKELGKISRFDKDNDRESSFRVQIFKRLKYVTNIVESTFILINQAIDENLIDFKVVEKSNELADEWLRVKGLIPEEILNKIEEDTNNDNDNDNDDNKSDGIVHNFKKLSLETKAAIDEPYKTDTSTQLKDKRRSRAGHFLMGKMNLVPVMIEHDPTSVRKPDESNNKVLMDSLKANQLEFGQEKPNLLNPLRNIPNLQKNHSLEDEILNDGELLSSHSPQVHEDTLAQLTGDLSLSPMKHDDSFETPVPKSKRNNTIYTTAATQGTKMKPPQEYSFRSKIPRPVSRLGTVSDRSQSRLGSTSRSISSLGIRTTQRPATSLAISRASSAFESATPFRHSIQPMIKETPVRSSRRSLIPLPTPIKEVIEGSGSRLSEPRRLSGRLETPYFERNSGSSSRLSSRPVSSNNSKMAPPPKPVWK